MALLELVEVSKYFGGLAALNEVSLEVHEGEILGLIGPNGSGKTTTFNVISGFLRATSGTVILDGKDITHLRPDLVPRRGIGRTFQQNVLFKERTCFTNLMMAHHLHLGTNEWSVLFATSPARRKEAEAREDSLELLEFMGLGQFQNEMAGQLPHGYQRALGVGMALATKPRLLLLDEAVTGLNAGEIEHMISLIQAVREEKGITIVLIEHNMRVVMGTSDRIAVLNYGRKIADGLPSEVAENEEVIKAYLGAKKK